MMRRREEVRGLELPLFENAPEILDRLDAVSANFRMSLAIEKVPVVEAEHRQREAQTIFGSGGLSFRTWGADKSAISPGESAHICYGIVDAKTVRIDPPVRDYLDRLIGLSYLPWPARVAFGPVNRFLTTGFLPPPFREQMRLGWSERDQQAFALLIQMIATVSRVLPAPISQFPFNACLADLRLRRMLSAR